MAGFRNNILFCTNVDFSGGFPVTGKVTQDGQLLIGAGSAPFIRVAKLTSTGGTLSIGNGPGSINLEASSSIPTTFNADSGSATPAANVLTVSGQLAGTVPAMFTIGSGSTVDIENRTWITSYVVDPSSTVGLRGTFTTIQAAITAASSGQTIFIRPGTYTENLTLKNGVNLVSMANSASVDSPVVITGKATLTSGTVAMDNISFSTNSDYIFEISGGARINAYRCFFRVATTGAFNLDTGNINLRECYSTSQSGSTPLITAINSSTVQITNSWLSSSSTSASSFSGTTSLVIYNSTFGDALTFGGTGTLNAYNCRFGRVASALAALTITGTNTNFQAYNCFFETGAVTCITIGTGSTLTMSNCAVGSTAGTGIAISGAGTLNYSALGFSGTASEITTTTQVPKVLANDAVKIKTPGAYPYTTVPQDAVILVDTSTARTIVPLASPTTGQKHVIKDSVGSAASNNITITPSGKNIDGGASAVINTNYGSMTIVYNGTEWSIV